MTSAATRAARAQRGIATEGRSPEELRELVSHWGAELELARANATPFARTPLVINTAARIRGVRRERGMAGKFVEEGGLLVITWEHGSRTLDTGFRAERVAEQMLETVR